MHAKNLKGSKIIQGKKQQLAAMKGVSTQNSMSLFGTEFEQLGSRNMQSIIMESSYARTNNSLDNVP